MVDSYSGYGGYGSPSSAADVRRRLALAMMERGLQGGAKNGWDGASQAVQSIFGGLALNRLEQQEQASNGAIGGQAQALINSMRNGSLYGTGGAGASGASGAGTAPAPSSAPLSAPPPPASASPGSPSSAAPASPGAPSLIQPNFPGWGGGPGAGTNVASLNPGAGLPALPTGGGLFDSARQAPPPNYGGPTARAADGTPVYTDRQGRAIDPATGQPTQAMGGPNAAAVQPSAAAQQVPAMAAGAGYPSTQAGHEQFIRDYALSKGLNPDFAVAVARGEGLGALSAKNPNSASSVDIDPKTGKPFSFGDFQLNVRNGLGNVAMANGIDPSDPSQWQAADKFSLDTMVNSGVQPWRGDAGVNAWGVGSNGSWSAPRVAPGPAVAVPGAPPLMQPASYANPPAPAPASAAISAASPAAGMVAAPGAPSGGNPAPIAPDPNASPWGAMNIGRNGHLPPPPTMMANWGGAPSGGNPAPSAPDPNASPWGATNIGRNGHLPPPPTTMANWGGAPSGGILINPPAPPPPSQPPPSQPQPQSNGGSTLAPPSTNGGFQGGMQMANAPPPMPQPGNGIGSPGSGMASGFAAPGGAQMGNGVGFNPLANLASMFGIGNPSQPQSGNAQTTGAASGSPAGLDPQILQRVMLDPYSSPQARELAGQILNTYMTALAPHQLRDVVDPRTGATYQVDSITGRIRGVLPTGKAPEFGVIGKDASGAETYGWRDPATQQITPYQPQGQVVIPPYPGGGNAPSQPQPQPSAAAPPSAPAPGGGSSPPAPQPGAPPPSPLNDTSIPRGPVQGESYLDSVLARYPNNPSVQTAVNLARGYLRGDLPTPSGQAGEKPAEVMARQLVAAVPGFNPGIYAQRQKALTDYNDGTKPDSAGGMITNANAAVGHLSDLMDASEQLGQAQNGHGPVLNELLGWKADHIDGTGPLADARKRFQAAVTPFAGEITKFFTGSEGDAATREAYRDIIDENQTPEQRRASAQTLASMLQTKIGVLAQRYQSATGGQAAYPVELQQAQDQLARIMSLGKPAQGGRAQAAPASALAPELTEQQYNAAPSGTHYRVPGSYKVMVKP